MRRLVLVLALFMASCATFRAPAVRPFADNRAWMLVESIRYEVGNSGVVIEVPAGFVTDYASVPNLLWGVLSPHEQYSRAAVVHDYLYWSQKCTKDQADNLMMIAMKETGVPILQQFAVYGAVALLGQSSWDENKTFRQQGYIRRIPSTHWSPPSEETWKNYRSTLQAAKVQEIEDATPAKYCSLGNTRTVPQR